MRSLVVAWFTLLVGCGPARTASYSCKLSDRSPTPSVRLAVATEPSLGESAALVVQVVELGAPTRRVSDAYVSLSTPTGTSIGGSLGRDGDSTVIAAPGQYELRVRRMTYVQAQRSIVLRAGYRDTVVAALKSGACFHGDVF